MPNNTDAVAMTAGQYWNFIATVWIIKINFNFSFIQLQWQLWRFIEKYKSMPQNVTAEKFVISSKYADQCGW